VNVDLDNGCKVGVNFTNDMMFFQSHLIDPPKIHQEQSLDEHHCQNPACIHDVPGTLSSYVNLMKYQDDKPMYPPVCLSRSFPLPTDYPSQPLVLKEKLTGLQSFYSLLCKRKLQVPFGWEEDSDDEIFDEIAIPNIDQTQQFIRKRRIDFGLGVMSGISIPWKDEAANYLQKLLSKPTFPSCIFKLKAHLMNVQPAIFRVFEASGSITLNELADRVLVPAFGLLRDYHTWVWQEIPSPVKSNCFEPFDFGLCLSPVDSNAIDSFHRNVRGMAYVDDSAVTLAHLVSQQGDKLLWCYDLGEMYRIKVEVLDLYHTAKSTSNRPIVRVTQGQGNSLPEDIGTSEGFGWANLSFAFLLDRMYRWAPTSRVYREAQAEFHGKANTRVLLDKAHGFYNPAAFSLKATNRAVQVAMQSSLKGNGSLQTVKSPALKHIHNLGVEATEQQKQLCHKAKDDEYDNAMREQTHIGTKECAVCGKRENLKACSGCMIVHYCSSGHQKKHWKAEHKQICSGALSSHKK